MFHIKPTICKLGQTNALGIALERHSKCPRVDSQEFVDAITDWSIFEDAGEIRFIDLEVLEKLNEFPRCPDHIELTTPLKFINRDRAFLVFLSHCWLRGSADSEEWAGRPHPDNTANSKFKIVVAGLRMAFKLATVRDCYVWIDYCCVDQDHRSFLSRSVKNYQQIIALCDAICTPIVDTLSNFKGFESTVLNSGPHAYMSRAWCRMEMMYAANLPVVPSSTGIPRHSLFKAGLTFACRQGRRPHILVGQMSSFHMLPALRNVFFKQYHPLKGKVSVLEDLKLIEQLVDDVEPLIKVKTPKEGYTGGLDSRGKYHGSYVFGDGSRYEGSFQDGVIHGKGIYYFANGSVYEGEYFQDKRQGHGVMMFANGNEYRGEWLNHVWHGSGEFNELDGSFYHGAFKNDEKHGVGIFHIADQTEIFIGVHLDGRLMGTIIEVDMYGATRDITFNAGNGSAEYDRFSEILEMDREAFVTLAYKKLQAILTGNLIVHRDLSTGKVSFKSYNFVLEEGF